jgi:hypothetical protein
MLWIVGGVLRELRPLVYYALAGILFIISQLTYFLLSRTICDGTNAKIDGSFIATVLDTAAVVVLYLAWQSITEGASFSAHVFGPPFSRSIHHKQITGSRNISLLECSGLSQLHTYALCLNTNNDTFSFSPSLRASKCNKPILSHMLNVKPNRPFPSVLIQLGTFHLKSSLSTYISSFRERVLKVTSRKSVDQHENDGRKQQTSSKKTDRFSFIRSLPLAIAQRSLSYGVDHLHADPRLTVIPRTESTELREHTCGP